MISRYKSVKNKVINVPFKAFSNIFQTVLIVCPKMDPDTFGPLHFLEDYITATPGFQVS